MLYQMEVAQKKSGNLLVAATPTDLATGTRSEAAPYRSGEALLEVARAAGCAPDALAAMEDAIRDAERHPDTPVRSREIELADRQLGTLGLRSGAAA